MRCAFTLMELLLVVAICGVLLGLLLPAVQGVRQVALQAQCQSHLHQIGIASHGYINVVNIYPHEQMVSHTTSLFTALLPFVESDAIYTCPSRRATRGKTDYCGVWSATLGGGHAITDQIVGPAQIDAGTSNVILLAHKAMQPIHYFGDTSSWDAGYGVTKDTVGGGDHIRCADNWGEGSSAKKGYTRDDATVDQNHCGGPHPSASPVLYADGSVRPYCYHYTALALTNVQTWQQLWSYDRQYFVLPPQ